MMIIRNNYKRQSTEAMLIIPHYGKSVFQSNGSNGVLFYLTEAIFLRNGHQIKSPGLFEK